MLFRIRKRINTTIGALIGSMAFLGCGLVFTLFLAPQQKLEALNLSRLPIMDGLDVSQANTGDEILITGKLSNNPILLEGKSYVAYTKETWDVALPEEESDSSDLEPSGNWKMTEQSASELLLDIQGVPISVLASDHMIINGTVHQEIIYSDGYYSAEYMGELIPEDSQKLRGFYNGDIVTAWGGKAASDSIVIDELFGGDRISFVDSKHESAKGLLIAGITMVACSPVILIGGILASIFSRRKR